MKVAVLTDLHVGSPHVGPEKLRRVVELANEERPDLVVILGDLVIQGVAGGEFVTPDSVASFSAGEFDDSSLHVVSAE